MIGPLSNNDNKYGNKTWENSIGEPKQLPSARVNWNDPSINLVVTWFNSTTCAKTLLDMSHEDTCYFTSNYIKKYILDPMTNEQNEEESRQPAKDQSLTLNVDI